MSGSPPRRRADAGERPPTFLGAPVTPLQVVLFVLAFLLFALAGRWAGRALSDAGPPPSPPAATATAAAGLT